MASYPSAFEKAIDHTMLYEVGGFWDENHPAVESGDISTPENRRAVGYVNDPLDQGGETKFGVAKNGNPDLNIHDLTWEQAKSVYYVRYWLAGKCDQVQPRVGVLQFDGAVNHGVKRANMFVQRAVGVNPDGVIGPITIARVMAMNEFDLVTSICSQREQFYRDIVAANPPQARYLAGWLRRIAEVRAFVSNSSSSFS
jgi:lysozyme family protein